MGEGELDRMCDEANRDWLRACVVADAVMLPTGVRSVAFTHQDSNSAPAHSDPDTHTPGAWPEPYDPAGDSDTDTGSLNTGLDRLGDHGACQGGFGRVDRAQSMDRQGRDVPPDGREPVRDPHREAADAMTRMTRAVPTTSGANHKDGTMTKTLHNSDVSGARKNVPDIKVVGNGDLFALLCKASSDAEGWMKSTKAMPVPGGCVVQVTTQQRNPDGSYAVAEALTFVPNAAVVPDVNGGRKLG